MNAHAFLNFRRAFNLFGPSLVYPNGDINSTRNSAPFRSAPTGTMKRSLHKSMRLPLFVMLLAAAYIAGATVSDAQAPSHFVGSITGITANTLTVKTDTGDQHQFDVPAEAVIKRIAPGEKDLSKAESMAFSELAVGDRVLVKMDVGATAPTPQAAQIIAVKAADLAQKQQKDREAWQRNGVAGLVKNVDPGSGAITLTTGAGATSKTVTVHTSKSTVLKRYAPPLFVTSRPSPRPWTQFIPATSCALAARRARTDRKSTPRKSSPEAFAISREPSPRSTRPIPPSS